MGQHCFIGGWHSHIGRCHHCQPYSRRLGIANGSFSWGGCWSGGLGEGRLLLRPLPIEHVFSSCHKGFWVSSLVV